MPLAQFLNQVATDPNNLNFKDTIAIIDAHYDFTPVAFQNGNLRNAAGQNSGSCKIFAFALLHQLSKEHTLHCFGDYYRVDVLQHPNGEDHQNIRNFIQFGWRGIEFSDTALIALGH